MLLFMADLVKTYGESLWPRTNPRQGENRIGQDQARLTRWVGGLFTLAASGRGRQSELLSWACSTLALDMLDKARTRTALSGGGRVDHEAASPTQSAPA